MMPTASISRPDPMGVDISSNERTRGVEREETVGELLLDRLRVISVPGLRRVRNTLARCSIELGHRCGSQVCPRCSRRTATKHRRSIERKIAALPPNKSIGMLTLTCNCGTLEEGLFILRRALLKFRKLAVANWMEAGAGQVEFKKAITGRPWLVHAHLVVVCDGPVPSHKAMTRAWMPLLGDLAGRVHWRAERSGHRRYARWSYQLGGRFSPLAFYCSKRKRSELLALDDERLAEVAVCVPGKRWKVRPFGRWPTAEQQQQADVRGGARWSRIDSSDGMHGVADEESAGLTRAKASSPRVVPASRCASSSPPKTRPASPRTRGIGRPRTMLDSNDSSGTATLRTLPASGCPCPPVASGPDVASTTTAALTGLGQDV